VASFLIKTVNSQPESETLFGQVPSDCLKINIQPGLGNLRQGNASQAIPQKKGDFAVFQALQNSPVHLFALPGSVGGEPN